MLRGEVIQDASQRIGDLEIGTLTGGVGNDEPIDTGRTEPDGHWTDAWMTVNGVERRVTGYTKPGLFETNAYPFDVEAGDPYELRRDQLHTREQMVAFANAAVRDVQLLVWVLVDSYLDDLDPLTAVPDTTAYPVPAEMECVYHILYRTPTDPNWYPIAPLQWFVNEPEMVTLYEPIIPVGSRIRFLGTRRPVEMPTDFSTCEVEPSFVAVFAAKLMSIRMMKGTEGDRMKTIYAALREEEQVLRRTMRIRQPNNIRRVRPTGTGATAGTLVPVTLAHASQWYTGEDAPTISIGRPGDMYLQGDGTVWQFVLPGGWTMTGTSIEGPPGDVDAAIVEYDALDQPLDVVP